MKKIYSIIIVLFVAIVLTGCTNNSDDSVTCSLQREEGNMKVIEKIKAILEDGKVKSLNLIFDIDDSDYFNEMYEFYDSYNMAATEDEKVELSKSGSIITIKKAERILETEDNKYIGLTKEEFELKAKYSDDVTCK